MALKQKIFALLDKATPPHAILGTNTSSLDIDQIASATTRAGAVASLRSAIDSTARSGPRARGLVPVAIPILLGLPASVISATEHLP